MILHFWLAAASAGGVSLVLAGAKTKANFFTSPYLFQVCVADKSNTQFLNCSLDLLTYKHLRHRIAVFSHVIISTMTDGSHLCCIQAGVVYEKMSAWF